jgi:hypothetical protein
MAHRRADSIQADKDRAWRPTQHSKGDALWDTVSYTPDTSVSTAMQSYGDS